MYGTFGRGENCPAVQPMKKFGHLANLFNMCYDKGGRIVGMIEERLGESEELDRRKRYLSNALSTLNDREKRIFEARRLAEEPATLEDLSAEFGVSRERIRQIEVRAFEKVQAAVQKSARKEEGEAARAAGA